MKKWNDLSANAREVMLELGNFGPTTKGDTVKGWTINENDWDLCKTYYDAYDLKKIAEACLEVSAWLTANTQGAMNED